VPGVAAAVVADGEIRSVDVAGVADAESGELVERASSFLWFSMTKLVTATTAMRLVEAGLLGLDTEVGAIRPDLLPAGAPPITVGDLLRHRAGIRNPMPVRWVRPAGDPPRPADELIARVGRPLRRRQDDLAHYSNLGYLLLGEVLATVGGSPFTELVHEQVLSPFGMASTSFDPRAARQPDPVTGHQRRRPGLVPALQAMLPAGVVGGRVGRWLTFQPFLVDGAAYGGLVGPVDDAARFLLAHARDGDLDGGQVLAPSTARAMREITCPGRPYDQGLGWGRPHGEQGAGFVQHFGGGAGYWNLLRLHESGEGVVLMGNSTRWDADGLARRLVAG
jgi:CubicO group peptidase (beta-lactamase class C family)